MGRPAARLTDMHTCPMVIPGSPPIPHVGGPIIGPGCPTVLIGGLPAATIGDSCVCVGPLDVIARGSTGVFIGGKPAARMGDNTAHGGVIVAGCPTVLIGEVGGGGGSAIASMLGQVGQGGGDGDGEHALGSGLEGNPRHGAGILGEMSPLDIPALLAMFTEAAKHGRPFCMVCALSELQQEKKQKALAGYADKAAGRKWEEEQSQLKKGAEEGTDFVGRTPLESQQSEYHCDVDGLKLVWKNEDKAKTAIVETPVNRSHRNDTPIYPPDHSNAEVLSGQYDLVVEILAAPVQDKKKNNPEEIGISFAHVGGECGFENHAPARLIPLAPGDYDEPNHKIDLVQGGRSIKVFAPGLTMDCDRRFKYLDVVRFFKDRAKPKHIEVLAQGCGHREDGKAVNSQIKGLIRVCRREDWSLHFVLPAQGGKKGGMNKYAGKKAEKYKSTEEGVKVYRKGDDASKYGYAHTIEDEGSWYGTTTRQKRGDKTSFKKFDSNFSIQRNGESLEIGDTINNLIKIQQHFLKAYNLIDELKDLVPKVGFYFDWELEFLSGDLSADFGYRPTEKYKDPHYHWLEQYGDVSADIILLKGEMEVGFGIEAVSPGILNWGGVKAYELILKVEIELEADLTLSMRANLFGPHGRTQSKIGNNGTETALGSVKGSAEPEIFIQAKVSLLGYGVDAKAGIEWGFDAELTLVKPLNLRAGIKRRELKLYAYWTHGKRKPSPNWEKVLVKKDGKETYCFS